MGSNVRNGHPCIKGKFPSWGGEGKNNRTFAFWGRILVPAAVFLAFLKGFCTFLGGSGGQIKFLIETKHVEEYWYQQGKILGRLAFYTRVQNPEENLENQSKL